MNVINLPGGTPTRIAAAGNRDFIHIYNNSGDKIYICYDSDDATAVANLTTATGIAVADQGVYFINNEGNRNIFNKPVYACSPSGGEVRVQGADAASA